jgi:hypothetical protein
MAMTVDAVVAAMSVEPGIGRPRDRRKWQRSFALAAGRAKEDWEGSGSGRRLDGHGDQRQR